MKASETPAAAVSEREKRDDSRPDPTVLVIGGSSGTGRAIVGLLHDHRVRTRVLTRHPARAARRLPAGVHLVGGDLTLPETLPAAIAGATAVILTAGVYSGHPATERRVKTTEYDGVLHVLTAAHASGFSGRLLYMTASGVGSRSLAARALNVWKGNTLEWRKRAEARIRASGLDYSIVRAGVLFDRPAGWRAVHVTQQEMPLSIATRLARADLAAVFVAALRHPSASHATFDVVGRPGTHSADWDTQLGRLRPDA
jgi:uncharacterized protein YbjT (DUF2867 family)